MDKTTKPIFFDYRDNKGQVIIEFTFCMIIIFLIIYASIKIFFWSGEEFIKRRKGHEAVLFNNAVIESYTHISQGPLRQLDSQSYGITKINAIWKPNN